MALNNIIVTDISSSVDIGDNITIDIVYDDSFQAISQVDILRSNDGGFTVSLTAVVGYAVAGGTASIPITVVGPQSPNTIFQVIDSTSGNFPLARGNSNSFRIVDPLSLSILFEDFNSNLKDNIFSYKIDVDVALELTLKPKNIFNHYDHMGHFLTLKRLPGEDNRSYKERLLDVYAHRGGANYSGLINGILRNLDLLRYEAFVIDQNVNILLSPKIEILADKILLYKRWNGPDDYELDPVYLDGIKFYDRTDPGYYIEDMVDLINESNYYQSALIAGVDGHVPTKTVIRGDNIRKIVNQQLNQASIQSLGKTYIIRNTLIFKSRAFLRDPYVTNLDITTYPKGTYSVDYTNGVVFLSGKPGPFDTVSFSYKIFPYTVIESHISLNAFRDENFSKHLFVQLTDELGNEISGLPNGEGLDIISELFSVSQIYWGK